MEMTTVAPANTTARPDVSIAVTTALRGVSPASTPPRYRVTMKSVTVRVVTDDESVQLTVDDDGHGSDSAAPGYGLVGMAERTKLLGGTFSAGHRPDGGWNVTAVLPRHGITP